MNRWYRAQYPLCPVASKIFSEDFRHTVPICDGPKVAYDSNIKEISEKLCDSMVNCKEVYQVQQGITQRNLATGREEMLKRINTFFSAPTTENAMHYLRISDISGLEEYPNDLLVDYVRCRIHAHAYEGNYPPHPVMKPFVPSLQEDIGLIRAFVKRLQVWLRCDFLSKMEHVIVDQLRSRAPEYLNVYYKVGGPARNANTIITTQACDLDNRLYSIINAIFDYYNDPSKTQYMSFEQLIPMLVPQETLDLLYSNLKWN